MCISSVKLVPWLGVNLHHLLSDGAEVYTPSRRSLTSYAISKAIHLRWVINELLRSLSVIYGSVYTLPCVHCKKKKKKLSQLKFKETSFSRFLRFLNLFFRIFLNFLLYKLLILLYKQQEVEQTQKSAGAGCLKLLSLPNFFFFLQCIKCRFNWKQVMEKYYTVILLQCIHFLEKFKTTNFFSLYQLKQTHDKHNKSSPFFITLN